MPSARLPGHQDLVDARNPPDHVADHLAGVVLAAGHGTRLRPLSDLRPKALCPVDGIPLVDHAARRLEPFVGAGPEHLAVNANHHLAQLRAHLGERAHLSEEVGIPLGTAGALGHLRDWLDGRDVLVTNADSWLRGDLTPLVRGWDGERCRLLTVQTGAPSDFGTQRYVGAALLPWVMVRHLRAEETGLYEVLWRAQDEAGRLELVDFVGVAIDAGTPRDYLAANLDASGGRSVVGEGAVVEGTLERCVVWDGAWVGPEEHLVDAVRAGDRDHPMTVSARR